LEEVNDARIMLARAVECVPQVISKPNHFVLKTCCDLMNVIHGAFVSRVMYVGG